MIKTLLKHMIWEYSIDTIFSRVQSNWRIWNLKVGRYYDLITANIILPDENGTEAFTDVEYPNAIIKKITGRSVVLEYSFPGMLKYLGVNHMEITVSMDAITGVYR